MYKKMCESMMKQYKIYGLIRVQLVLGIYFQLRDQLKSNVWICLKKFKI